MKYLFTPVNRESKENKNSGQTSGLTPPTPRSLTGSRGGFSPDPVREQGARQGGVRLKVSRSPLSRLTGVAKYFSIVCALLACAACDRASSSPVPAAPTEPPQNPSNKEASGEANAEASLLIDATAPDILKAATAPGASVTIVNVWATWCPPCVEEFPYLVQLHKNYADKGLRVVFVSFDYERQTKAVLQFLKKQGVTFPTYRRTGSDQTFVNELAPSWTGSLPFTLIYDRTGKLRRAWEKEATYQEFEEAILKLMQEP